MRFSESLSASHASLLIQPHRPTEAGAYVPHLAAVLAVGVLGESGVPDRQAGRARRKCKASQILPMERLVAKGMQRTGGRPTRVLKRQPASSKLPELARERANHENAFIPLSRKIQEGSDKPSYPMT